MNPRSIHRPIVAFLALSLVSAGHLAAAPWQLGPCGRNALCPGAYTPLPTPSSTQTPDPNAPTPTPWPTVTAVAIVPGPNQWRIDVGASGSHVGMDGAVWQGDAPYEPGGAGRTDVSAAYQAQGPVDRVSDAALFTRFRQGAALGYQFDVPAGNYRVRLYWAEFVAAAAGERVMKVLLQGQEQAAPVDVYAQVGANRAWAQDYQISVAAGPLTVQLQQETGQVALSAIAVEAVSVTPAPTPVWALTPFVLQLTRPYGATLIP